MSDQNVLNGRADDSQFAQNPLPVAEAMGVSLGLLHSSTPPEGLDSRTESEVEAALETLAGYGPEDVPPSPFARVRVSILQEMLSNPPVDRLHVPTHGAPIVSAAALVDSVVHFDPAGTNGFDPPERDLAIVIRSISETFTSEVSATFLEGYLDAGGILPHGPTLDWYGLVAAFR